MRDKSTRRRILIMVTVGFVVLIAVVVGVGFWLSSSETSYTRSATISVTSADNPPAPASGSGLNFSSNMLDISGLEDVGPVADRLVQSQGGTAEDYRARLEISATDTDLGVVLTATDDDEAGAVALANDAADAWVEIFNSTPNPAGVTFGAEVIDPAR